MKRSTANWTTAIAASALLAMPVGSWAQQASPTPSQTSRPAGAPADQKGSANQKGSAEHLRQAEAALNDIPAASLTGTARTKVAELKRHIATLNKSAGKSASAPAGKANWSTDVAAADRILTDLLGAGGTTGATGTSGATAAKPANKTTAVTLDETAKAKLQEVRTHLTAFAASMSGASAAPSTSTPNADDSSSSASASATAASASPTASATSPASTSPSSQASSSSTSTPAATPSEPSASASATPPAQAQSAQPAESVDTENVKRHLTAARDTLSQLTQLPAAAQLTGDSRTQVSQLISNFNELITTNTEWRAAYGKLQGNLNALVGDKSGAAPAAPATGTPGAVGTSGTTGLDPAIRAKLEEFRAHLSEFEKAAGGAAPMASAASASPAASATPAARTPDSSAAAAPAASASSPSTASPTASPSEPSPAAATGSTASSSAASTSTPSSTASPAAAASADPMPQSTAAPASAHQGTHGQSSDAMRHIEAIEAILNGGSPAETAGTSGSTAAKAKTSSPSSLDRTQIEKIRTHLSELRKALNK